MTLSDQFAQILENNGVKYIFGLPGEENLHLLNAIRNSSIKFILAHDERSASFMANALGRMSGTPGVVLSTLGPGAANLLPGVIQAHHLGIPLIALTAQKSLSEKNNRFFQSLDITELYDNLTKCSYRIDDAPSAQYDLLGAMKLALTHRRGPVHIEIPEDLSIKELDEEGLDTKIKIDNSMAEPEAIERMLNLIENARSPLLMVGNLPIDQSLFLAIREFITKSGIKFFNTPLGKSMSDETLSEYIGCAYVPDEPLIDRALKQSDLLIVIGHDPYENSPMIKGNIYKRVVNINYTPSQINSNYLVDLDLVGDVVHSLSYMTQFLRLGNYDDYPYRMISAENRNLQPKSSDPYDDAVNNLVENLSDSSSSSIVVLDNGEYKRAFSRRYINRTPGGFILDNSLATMGAGIAGGIAAKLLNPDKEVNVVTGDGGLMMSMSDISLAVREKLDVNIFVINDGKYEMISRKQSMSSYEDFGVHFNKLDLKKIAESMGAVYSSGISDLYSEIERREDNVRLIEIRV